MENTVELATKDKNESYIDNVVSMLSIVKSEKYPNDESNVYINGLLTDKVKPNRVFDVIYKAATIVDLKKLIVNNDNYKFNDISIIRLFSILLEVINDKKHINNRIVEFRELAINSYRFSYGRDSDEYTLPSMYIEDLKEKLILNDKDYLMSTHIDKLISAVGYINLCMFIDLIKYKIED